MREKIERALQRWLDAALARIDGRLDNVSLRSKLYSIFVFCVLCPLVLTDSIVMWMLYDTEHKSRQQTMENTAEAVAYELNTTIDAAVDLAQMIYQNRYINEFLQGSYPTPLDYYIAYNDLMEESLYEVVMGKQRLPDRHLRRQPRFHQRRLLCPPVQRAGGKLGTRNSTTAAAPRWSRPTTTARRPSATARARPSRSSAAWTINAPAAGISSSWTLIIPA